MKFREVAEHHDDLATVAHQQALVGDHEVGQLWRQEVPQTVGPLQLGHLASTRGSSSAFHGGQLLGLPPDRVVVALDPCQGSHPGKQLALLEGLGDEVVGARLEGGDSGGGGDRAGRPRLGPRRGRRGEGVHLPVVVRPRQQEDDGCDDPDPHGPTDRTRLDLRAARAPKVELHLHLEGTLGAARIVELAAAAGEPLPWHVDELFAFDGLEGFLAFLDWTCSLVRDPDVAEQVAYDCAARADRERTRYAEVIVNPTHWRGWRVGDLVTALATGFDRAAADGLTDCRLLLSLDREQSEDDAVALVRWMADVRPGASSVSRSTATRLGPVAPDRGSRRPSDSRVPRGSDVSRMQANRPGPKACATRWTSSRSTASTTACALSRIRRS